MADGVVKGRSDSISFAAQQFIKKAEECQTSLRDVENAANALQSEWEGRGSQAFHAVMAKFHAAGVNLVKELEDIATSVHKSGQAFTDLDEALMRGWDGHG